MRLIEWITSRVELERGGRANVPAMEGLRGLAVFLVFVAHYLTFTEPWLPSAGIVRDFSQDLFNLGQAGVDLFFVLSGYLIYGSWIRHRPRVLAYLRRRLQRIRPAFLAVFAVYTVLAFLRPDANRLPGGLGPDVAYLAANLLLLPGLFPITPLITVAWSLSYELAFYLALPVVVIALRLRAWSPLSRGWLFLGAGVAGGLACALVGGPVRLAMFLVGMLVVEVEEVEGDVERGARGHALARGPARVVVAASRAIGVALVVVGVAVASLPTTDSWSEAVRAGAVGASAFVIFQSAFRRQGSLAARVLSWTPLRWLGNVSYSYYLAHGLALNAIFLGLKGLGLEPVARPWLVLGAAAPVFAATLGVSMVLFLLVEQPFSLEPARERVAGSAGRPREVGSGNGSTTRPVGAGA